MNLFVHEVTPEMKPTWYYLVAVEGIYNTTIKHGTLVLHAPSNIYNETGNLCEGGTVVALPEDNPNEELLGEEVKFWYSEAHTTYVGNRPALEKHLLVQYNSIISVGDKTIGEYIKCSRIPLNTTAAGLFLPNIEVVSYDTLKTPDQNIRDYHTDKGIVSAENDHFPVGTVLYWGEDENARNDWEGGFLVRKRFVQAAGPQAQFLSFTKKKK
jgi:hypothetical protein